MAPTLQDVSFLLGLPLAGEPVGPLPVPDNWRADMEGRFAGLHDGDEAIGDDMHGPMVSWLNSFKVRSSFLQIFFHANVRLLPFTYCDMQCPCV